MFQTFGEVVLGCNRRQDGKLVASQTKCRFVHLHIQLEIEAYLQNIAVALVMAKDVITVLEVVDIDERHGNGDVLPPELLEAASEGTAIAQPCEGVGKGGLNQIVLTLEKVTDGLFERLGVIADSFHVLSGFLRSGRIALVEPVVYTRRCSALCVYPGPRLAALLS